MFARVSQSLKKLTILTFDAAKFAAKTALRYSHQAVILSVTYTFDLASAALEPENNIAKSSTALPQYYRLNYFFSESMYAWHQSTTPTKAGDQLFARAIFITSVTTLGCLGIYMGYNVCMENKRKKERNAKLKNIPKLLEAEAAKNADQKALEEQKRQNVLAQRNHFLQTPALSSTSEIKPTKEAGKVKGTTYNPRAPFSINSGNKQKRFQKTEKNRKRKEAREQKQKDAREKNHVHVGNERVLYSQNFFKPKGLLIVLDTTPKSTSKQTPPF